MVALCAIYGITAVFMTRYLYELQSSPVFLFLGCMIIATAVESGRSRWNALAMANGGTIPIKNGTWKYLCFSILYYGG